METENKKSLTPIAVVAAVLVAGGIGAYAFLNHDGESEEGSTNTNATTTSNTTGSNTTNVTPAPAASGTSTTGQNSTSPASAYKDGTYTATGNYVSPGGPEQVGVKLTIKNDIVTDAVFTPMAERPMSVQMQTAFAGGYKALVVGKDIDTINLTKVSGSSLTPKGFNDAVVKIKAQAKS